MQHVMSLGSTPLEETYIPPSPSASPRSFRRSMNFGEASPFREFQGFSVEKELEKSGYTPLTAIGVKNPVSAEADIKYVKAENNIGEQIYVVVDIPGAHSNELYSEPLFRESRSAFNIPTEEKELALSKAGFGVAGVAIECEAGLCTLAHEPSKHTPTEKYFMFTASRKQEETLTIASFPLVKLSDIKRNPVNCMENVDMSLRQMRNAALNKCLCEVGDVQCKVKKACHLFDETLECQKKAVFGFEDSMKKLENAYCECKKCACPDAKRLDDIIYNINKRNALFPCLLESCKQVAALNCHLDKIICDLEKTKHVLAHKFKYIQCAYERKKEKHCCVWDRDYKEMTYFSDNY